MENMLDIKYKKAYIEYNKDDKEQRMTERTKVAIGSSITNVVWFAILYFLQQNKAFASAEDLTRSWGKFFLLLLGGMVVLNVLLTIALTLREKAKGGRGFDEVVDERDQLFEKKVLKNFSIVFSLGFFLSMAMLAFGTSLSVFFSTLAFTVIVASLTFWLSYAWFYERG